MSTNQDACRWEVFGVRCEVGGARWTVVGVRWEVGLRRIWGCDGLDFVEQFADPNVQHLGRFRLVARRWGSIKPIP
jgi:hypothetical protein